MGLTALLVLFGLSASALASEEVVIKTSKGEVRGVRVDSDKGFYYYSFRGIRYAQPPVKELRFKVSYIYNTYSYVWHITFNYNFLKGLSRQKGTLGTRCRN